jgi:hypothetical protein
MGTYEQAVTEQRRPGRVSRDGSLDLFELVRLATLAASSHNTQPWTFRLEDKAVTVLPDFSRRCPVVDPDDGHLYKSLGCAAENVVHAAAAQGHVTQVAFDREESAIRVSLAGSPSAKAGDLFYAIPRRQCTKLPYDGRSIGANERDLLQRAGSGDGIRVLLIDDARTREAIVEYVREGDLTQLNDPAFRKELMTWLRFNDASAVRTSEGLALRTMGRPSAPDWLAKLIMRFALTGKAQAQADATHIRSSALIAVFVAGDDTPKAWVETGRAYERFALQATALDIRTAFINQPIEVRRLRPQLHSLLGLEGEKALLMLRVGYGPQAPFSLRRPLQHVIVPGTA